MWMEQGSPAPSFLYLGGSNHITRMKWFSSLFGRPAEQRDNQRPHGPTETDRLDYELHAIEADTHAETASRVSIARSWRDIARGYRQLADFLADAQAARQRQDPPSRE